MTFVYLVIYYVTNSCLYKLSIPLESIITYSMIFKISAFRSVYNLAIYYIEVHFIHY